ncbi:Noc2-domain-containing protein [Trichoderma longibrachiatum ATCC 18648]|uniref:Noc2-domain-containing protein n=1 Tax=Trichoderma longibrachiatum ATCC 18648 TaxID=983965 RepID=A0A2T4BQ74_TRILO|nr:Noc2-domain-containing protein [Trichoderma longibrachiatum ATCC 18648]
MGSSKKNLKATKKFEKKHLKDVLDKRKAGAKLKQKLQIREKQKAKRAQDSDFIKGSKEGQDGAAAAAVKKPAGKVKKVTEMSVDDFFQGGFEDIIDSKAKVGKLGKRKRGDTTKEDEASEASDSEVSVNGAPVASDSDDDESGDDDDDGDAAKPGMSKEAMKGLAERDPEFYKFLKENDPEALDFDENADLAEVDELSAGEEDSDEETPKKKRKKGNKAEEEAAQTNELTRGQIAAWRKAMAETKSLRATRQVVLAFRCAAHLNEADEEGQADQRWAINSPEVFNDILLLALKEVPVVMNHHLPVKESAAGKVYVQTEGKKFKTLSLLLKSYISSIMHLLSTLSDDGTITVTLLAIVEILPYLLSFKKLIKALAKSMVNLWAQAAGSHSSRVTAFRVIRRLVIIGDKGIRETVLKAVYQGLVQGCRVTNHNTLPGIDMMKFSAAGLWGIDPAVGYTTAFTFIRQLAIHLRNSIVNNKNNSFRMVYNWQFTHSLDFWARSRLNSWSSSPLPKASTLKPLDFAVSYRAPKSYLRTRVYQDGIGDEVAELMSSFLYIWSKSISFPELALPIIIQLKRWLKQVSSKSSGNKNAKLVSQFSVLVQKLEANAKFIEEKRARVDFAPKHRSQVDAFLKDLDAAKTPLGAYVVAQAAARAERAKVLAEARKEDEKKRKEDEKAGLKGDEEDEDDEGSEEDVDLAEEDDEEEEGDEDDEDDE